MKIRSGPLLEPFLISPGVVFVLAITFPLKVALWVKDMNRKTIHIGYSCWLRPPMALFHVGDTKKNSHVGHVDFIR